MEVRTFLDSQVMIYMFGYRENDSKPFAYDVPIQSIITNDDNWKWYNGSYRLRNLMGIVLRRIDSVETDSIAVITSVPEVMYSDYDIDVSLLKTLILNQIVSYFKTDTPGPGSLGEMMLAIKERKVSLTFSPPGLQIIPVVTKDLSVSIIVRTEDDSISSHPHQEADDPV